MEHVEVFEVVPVAGRSLRVGAHEGRPQPALPRPPVGRELLPARACRRRSGRPARSRRAPGPDRPRKPPMAASSAPGSRTSDSYLTTWTRSQPARIGGEGVVRGEPVGHRGAQRPAVQPLLGRQRHDHRVPDDDDEVRLGVERLQEPGHDQVRRRLLDEHLAVEVPVGPPLLEQPLGVGRGRQRRGLGQVRLRAQGEPAGPTVGARGRVDVLQVLALVLGGACGRVAPNPLTCGCSASTRASGVVPLRCRPPTNTSLWPAQGCCPVMGSASSELLVEVRVQGHLAEGRRAAPVPGQA